MNLLGLLILNGAWAALVISELVWAVKAENRALYWEIERDKLWDQLYLHKEPKP